MTDCPDNFPDFYRGLLEQWFLAEPLFFDVLCNHALEANEHMLPPLRVGNLKLEYNPMRLKGQPTERLVSLVKIQAVRILLKHPYQRQPLNARRDALLIASDITISEHYPVKDKSMYTIDTWRVPKPLELPRKRDFEDYYAKVVGILNAKTADEQDIREEMNEGGGKNWKRYENNTPRESEQEGIGDEMVPFAVPGNQSIPGEPGDLEQAAQQSANWEPNPVAVEMIDKAIDKAQNAKACGSVSAALFEFILASRDVPINVGRHLAQFRTSILSTERVKTRMRPSRRYGFAQMGVRHPYTTRLLVGIDTSASVPPRSLRQFIGVINHFFAQGVEQIDVMPFDCMLHPPVIQLRKATRRLRLSGRGGTNFQPIVDYYEASDYDGLIIFTDGEAQNPKFCTDKKVLWVLTSKEEYKRFQLNPKIYIPSIEYEKR